MYLQVKMLENGTTTVFSDEETTNKVPLMLLDVKVLTEWYESRLLWL